MRTGGWRRPAQDDAGACARATPYIPCYGTVQIIFLSSFMLHFVWYRGQGSMLILLPPISPPPSPAPPTPFRRPAGMKPYVERKSVSHMALKGEARCQGPFRYDQKIICIFAHARTHSHAHARTHAHNVWVSPLSLSLALSLTHTHPCFLSLSFSLSLALSLSHTHTHTHLLARSRARARALSLLSYTRS